ncbi:hypothetical protein [Bacillus marasmi]|uniref:hypothetical protein n=1 Tax=Bacillus marasmi TaxID=1926279 RepID=UPI0011CA2857|nr:hypothetical protein [Bacillus marasmi]
MWREKMVLLLIVIVLAGCQRDIPEPESKHDKSTVKIVKAAVAKDVMASPQSSSFEVRHQINGENVLVECKLQDISFRKNHPNKQVGKMIVSIDGKKKEEVDSPVFIIKGLTPGKHTITLQVVNLANQPYPLKKELEVVILKQ